MTRRVPQRLRASSGGFTLIELMIALVVSAIVVLGIFAFSSIQQATSTLHERNIRVQQALEGAMWSVSQDVRDAGLGWVRLCTELRVWDASGSRLINPGGALDPSSAVRDAVTGEAYWVLRDGLQAHWNSDEATSLAGDDESSASPSSAADSLDVIVAEANYTDAAGVFTLVERVDGVTSLVVDSAIDDTGEHLSQVQQLLPPGSFVVVVRPPPRDAPFRAENQGQCALLQITGDVASAGGTAWSIPVGAASGFNADLQQLLLEDPGGDPACGSPCDDWDPDGSDTRDNVQGAHVIPLGRLRWSRYEIDYAIEALPYLVRYDIIGWQDGDPANLGATDYPHCDAGACQGAQLHLPGSNSPPVAIAIGPMIEDMQVAVGCDGYTADAADNALPPLAVPDTAFEEVGPAGGPYAGVPNVAVDENSNASGMRDRDEWLGNAQQEQWAPDCVYYGTGQYNADAWAATEGAVPPPPFRMSPQTVRVTLTASSELIEQAGGLSVPTVLAVEDRPAMASPVGSRQRFSLTERFSPDNLRWRDAAIP